MNQTNKIYSVSASVKQIITRDIGKYGGHSGVNKFFHLMNIITHLTQHLGEEKVIKEVNNKLKELKKFEEETGNKTIYSHVQSYEQIDKKFKSLRPKLDEIQLTYDLISDKKFVKEKEDKLAKINYKKLTKKISPYQPELYFMFNLLMKMCNLQNQTISPENFKTKEWESFTVQPFKKSKEMKPTEESG